MKYVFMCGTPDNRYRGMICTIGWVSSNGQNCIVYFDKEEVAQKGLGLDYEFASIHNLIEVTE